MRDDVALPARSLRVRAIVGGVLTGLGALALLIRGAQRGPSERRWAWPGWRALALLVGDHRPGAGLQPRRRGSRRAPRSPASGAVGRLAVRNAQRDRRRTAATATAILIGLALVTAIGVLGASTTKSIDALVDDVVTADFIVQPTSFVPVLDRGRRAHRAVPGVATGLAGAPGAGHRRGCRGLHDRCRAGHHRAGPVALACPRRRWPSGGIVVDTETAARGRRAGRGHGRGHLGQRRDRRAGRSPAVRGAGGVLRLGGLAGDDGRRPACRRSTPSST